jgi:hypothetical protein
MNRWSTHVPVELSNRELHREGWEHDGVCLKVSVAETSAVSATARIPTTARTGSAAPQTRALCIQRLRPWTNSRVRSIGARDALEWPRVGDASRLREYKSDWQISGTPCAIRTWN